MIFKKTISCLVLGCLLSSNVNATLAIEHVSNPRKFVFQLGGFQIHQGRAQHINIEGLIGDDFSINSKTSSNGLVGLGYYLEGQETNLLNLSYGINAFYLAKTGVGGEVTQEQLFTNLSYHYTTSNYPIYLAAKASIKNSWSDRFQVTVDAGVGPNIVKTSSVEEMSLDGGVTIPDRTYSGRTSASFSAMAGIGLKINQFFGEAPLECGYRFFYLGQGRFNKLTPELMDSFKTGNVYANAVVCSLTI